MIISALVLTSACLPGSAHHLAAARTPRSSVLDFYRPASSRQDPNWAAFVQARQQAGTMDTATGPASDPTP
jgi:hypothetical protein